MSFVASTSMYRVGAVTYEKARTKLAERSPRSSTLSYSCRLVGSYLPLKNLARAGLSKPTIGALRSQFNARACIGLVQLHNWLVQQGSKQVTYSSTAVPLRFGSKPSYVPREDRCFGNNVMLTFASSRKGARYPRVFPFFSLRTELLLIGFVFGIYSERGASTGVGFKETSHTYFPLDHI